MSDTGCLFYLSSGKLQTPEEKEREEVKMDIQFLQKLKAGWEPGEFHISAVKAVLGTTPDNMDAIADFQSPQSIMAAHGLRHIMVLRHPDRDREYLIWSMSGPGRTVSITVA